MAKVEHITDVMMIDQKAFIVRTNLGVSKIGIEMKLIRAVVIS